jgi:hypothetical protein
MLSPTVTARAQLMKPPLAPFYHSPLTSSACWILFSLVVYLPHLSRRTKFPWTQSLFQTRSEKSISVRLCMPGADSVWVLHYFALSYMQSLFCLSPWMMQKYNLPHPERSGKHRRVHSCRKLEPDSAVVQHVASGCFVWGWQLISAKFTKLRHDWAGFCTLNALHMYSAFRYSVSGKDTRFLTQATRDCIQSLQANGRIRNKLRGP